jgi:hypothetical protein
MGNLVVSVNWRSIPDDHIIRKTLTSYADKHGIPTNINPNYLQYINGYETYGVGYEGWSLLFGRKTCEQKLQQFVNDCAQFLRSMNVEFKIQSEQLHL